MSALPSHLELVQGVVLPKPVGADPALDFLNTRSDFAGRGPARSEWLTSYEAFVIWNGYVGLLSDASVFRLIEQAAVKPKDAAHRFDATLEFRADLYDVLTDAGAGGSFDAVARAVERATARRRLTAVPAVGLGFGAGWDLPEDLGLPLDQLALLAADLLTGASRDHVHLCPGDACGWLFLDPRGRRRWCSMSTCGNRSKVRAHAARTR
ncbi:CGNR zinc finger domain-containing protein [Kribbella sp. VKM Ac-2568]|uniref:CGNR zinc finger domain-containing protein n=1 Tax=Kribbella sp. VKM Ac-2568 TaxID=2512219 RepID=UPI00104EF1BA|nr:CGNR zinc finger domain-containing protein [Kribbella sp. VKM Ac-2568]TCM41729.1 putative stress-induced transcription regulator [Kribbella sp. VKM Ac-2568]